MNYAPDQRVNNVANNIQFLNKRSWKKSFLAKALFFAYFVPILWHTKL